MNLSNYIINQLYLILIMSKNLLILEFYDFKTN